MVNRESGHVQHEFSLAPLRNWSTISGQLLAYRNCRPSKRVFDVFFSVFHLHPFIASFPMKNGPFSKVMLVYHRVMWNHEIYHLVMTNSLPWKDPPMFKFGKPSISIRAIVITMAMFNSQRVNKSCFRSHVKCWFLLWNGIKLEIQKLILTL